MLKRIANVSDVADWRLCIGCGACQYACRQEAVSLVDIVNDGIRPLVDEGRCVTCGECLLACPGYTVDASLPPYSVVGEDASAMEFGKCPAIWQGYAADEAIRFKGASGGVLSALALYCLEQEHMACVVHAGPSTEHPWRNVIHFSSSKEDVLHCAGSRYSPASPCDGLAAIEAGAPPLRLHRQALRRRRGGSTL